MHNEFTTRVISLIKEIPEGKVSTYGAIAKSAGSPRAARQVARILHSCAKKEQLPWHRVVNKQGKISLGKFKGYEEQKCFLEMEGVTVDAGGGIDLDKYLWRPLW